jgi:hypothetical protein
MFKLHKPFTLLTQAQQESARELAAICHWPEYEIRYLRVYFLEGDKVLASYPMNNYLNEFGIDCPECKGELSRSECYEAARNSARAKNVDTKDDPEFHKYLRDIHRFHCKGCRECES